jgi:hypothetical protein
MSIDSTNLTRMAVTGTIHPDLLDKLNRALTPAPFNPDSTIYHMGYAQAQSDFQCILNYHLNKP